MKRLVKEFLELHQTTEIVAKITAKVWERALLIPQYVADEDTRRTMYHSKKRDDICEFVSFIRCKTLNEMMEKSRQQEMELELRTKRKPE